MKKELFEQLAVNINEAVTIYSNVAEAKQYNVKPLDYLLSCIAYDSEKRDNAIYEYCQRVVWSTCNHMLHECKQSNINDANMNNDFNIILRVMADIFRVDTRNTVKAFEELQRWTIDNEDNYIIEKDNSKEAIQLENELLRVMAEKSTDNKAEDLMQDCLVAVYELLAELKGDYLKVDITEFSTKAGVKENSYSYAIYHAIAKTTRKYINGNKRIANNYSTSDMTMANKLYVNNGVVDNEFKGMIKRLSEELKSSKDTRLNKTENIIFKKVYISRQCTLKELSVKLGVNYDYICKVSTNVVHKILKCPCMAEYSLFVRGIKDAINVNKSVASGDTVNSFLNGVSKLDKNMSNSKTVVAYFDDVAVGQYESINAMCRILGLNKGKVSAIMGTDKKHHGYTFKQVLANYDRTMKTLAVNAKSARINFLSDAEKAKKVNALDVMHKPIHHNRPHNTHTTSVLIKRMDAVNRHRLNDSRLSRNIDRFNAVDNYINELRLNA